MNKVSLRLLIFVFSFSLCSVVFSAAEIELENIRTVNDVSNRFSVNALYDGDKARLTFHTNDASGVVSGTYLLSIDGGKTIYLISDNEENEETTCYKWSNQDFVHVLGKYMFKITNRYNINVSDPVTTKVFEKDAEKIHGLPTKHIRITSKFNANYTFLFFSDELKIERQFDAWVTPLIEGVKTKPILQRTWQATGYRQVDKMLIEISELLNGYVMRSELVQTITDKDGEKTITRIVQNINSVKLVDSFPVDTFKLPACEKSDSGDMEKRAEHLLFVMFGQPL